MTLLNNAPTLFLSLLFETIPFLLLGVAISSLLLVLGEQRSLSSFCPGNPFLAAFLGSCLGLVLPVCKYGNIPVVRRLLTQGVSAPLAIGFFLGAPTINAFTLYSTSVAFQAQPQFVTLRVVFTVAIATLVGYIFKANLGEKSFLAKDDLPEYPTNLLRSATFTSEERAKLGDHQSKFFGRNLNLFLDNFIKESTELGSILLFSCGIVALIQVFLPRLTILDFAQGPVTSILSMLALSTVISTGSAVNAFFANFFTSSFSNGSMLAFLLFGSIFDLKVLALTLAIFRFKPALYLLIIPGLLIFLITLFMNLHIN
ncbi:MAG: permease [Spirulinaceae cyanobacterium]